MAERPAHLTPCPNCGADYTLQPEPAEPFLCCCGDPACKDSSPGGGPVWGVTHTGDLSECVAALRAQAEADHG